MKSLLLVLLVSLCHVILADPLGLQRYNSLSATGSACQSGPFGGTRIIIRSHQDKLARIRRHVQAILRRGGATTTNHNNKHSNNNTRSWWIPSGYHPYGYQITELGEEFLSFPGSMDCDLGRFLASLKKRKTTYALKTAWLEVVRNSKTSQSLNIYKRIDQMIKFCLQAKLID